MPITKREAQFTIHLGDVIAIILGIIILLMLVFWFLSVRTLKKRLGSVSQTCPDKHLRKNVLTAVAGRSFKMPRSRLVESWKFQCWGGHFALIEMRESWFRVKYESAELRNLSDAVFARRGLDGRWS